MSLISCSAKFIGDLTLWGRNQLLYWETVKAQNGVSRLSGGMLWPFASDLSGFFPATAAAGGGSSCSCSFFEKGVET